LFGEKGGRREIKMMKERGTEEYSTERVKGNGTENERNSFIQLAH
jgi:hypothetical protein